jgi:nucleoside-diphosphate kinase
VRKLFGTNVGENAVHGSDSEENGRLECSYYFAGMDLL